MAKLERPRRAVSRVLVIALSTCVWTGLANATDRARGASESDNHVAATPIDTVRPHIDAVLDDPEVARHISEWGLTVADVAHDIDSMTPGERVELAFVLARHWRPTAGHTGAQLQAQFLVTMSLMRESTLFASVVSSGTGRSFR